MFSFGGAWKTLIEWIELSEYLDGAGNSGLQKTTVTLTDDQIKSLGSSPIEAVAAPGAGKAIVLILVTLSVRSTVAYVTTGKKVQFFIGSDASSFIGLFDDGMFTAGTDLFAISSSPFTGNDDLDNAENKALVLSTEDETDYTDGDAGNSAILTFIYDVCDV